MRTALLRHGWWLLPVLLRLGWVLWVLDHMGTFRTPAADLAWDILAWKGVAEGTAGGLIPGLDFPVDYPFGAVVLHAPLLVLHALLGPLSDAAWVGTYCVLSMIAEAVMALLLWHLLPASLVKQHRQWFLGVLLCLPTLIFVGPFRFEAVVLALMFGGLLAWRRGRFGLSGALLGLGASLKLFPILMLVALVVEVPLSPKVRQQSRAVVAAALAFLAVHLPVGPGLLAAAFHKTETYVEHYDLGEWGVHVEEVPVTTDHPLDSLLDNLLHAYRWTAEEGVRIDATLAGVSHWFELSPQLPPWLLPAMILALAFAPWRWGAERRYLAMVSVPLLFGPVFSAQYLLWCTPLLALLLVRAWPGQTRKVTAAFGLLATMSICNVLVFPALFAKMSEAQGKGQNLMDVEGASFFYGLVIARAGLLLLLLLAVARLRDTTILVPSDQATTGQA